ncbi:hypothetical protein [Mesorhizobium amorphae]|uniref:Uncharacterized protein n=1 Tax=Mesorhizobium amorphae CCNWGS0123 TaxID=1082933 RepID=G6YF57_9HYPH|nr:hypothetical protein [Mesorhizobium amorphae]ANT51356.1 hypothetical protein A6B35_16330 [Mesorhizobium amorphae CCNWGS0123]EHH09628.1 hypothetical protein MEA186_23021 [Mesorhizobium amorphae CCNWGS0123]GLR45181.1 hypothetical protein GCM10007880_56980 [Mesorhizobium amorphae]
MTLVAGLSVGGLPAFIGDLLVSWRIPSAIDLPTRSEEGVYPGIGEDHAAGLAQKLIIVRPYLMLAWAGERKEVDRMVRDLDSALPLDACDLRNPTVILEILDTCAANTELVALLIMADAIHPIGVRTRGFELGDKRIYLLGSGASDFFEYLQAHPELLPNQERADGLVARAIMLRFAARAMMLQLKIGTGLHDSWGGGFEIAYADRDGFRKVDNLMFRAWMIDEKSIYHNSGRSFFLRYYGQDLHLSWFNPDEKTYIVRSPIGKASEVPEHEEVHPEWTVDVFVMKKNGSFVEFARFQPPHRPPSDKVQLQNGVLVGWVMDQRYVDLCASKALQAADKGAHFEMIRY